MTKQPFQAGKIDWSKREIYPFPLPPHHSPSSSFLHSSFSDSLPFPLGRGDSQNSGFRGFGFLPAFTFETEKKQRKRVGIAIKRKGCEGLKELAHTMDWLQLILFSNRTGAFFFWTFGGFLHVPSYTDLLPHWRDTLRDTYNEYIFK